VPPTPRRFTARRLAALAAAALFLSPVATLAAANASSFSIPKTPSINARAVVVMDAATGQVILSKNPDLVVPPASLTKLVALHVIYEEIESGRLSKDEILTIDRRDCSPYIPFGSSLVYLQPGMRVSVLDLMLGAAVVSGNDAAFALARRVSGSNEAFAARMNESVRFLGLPELRFVEPSGLSELNRATALSFARFCRAYLELHPHALEELHSVKYIEFPRAEHATESYRPEGRIVQWNRNSLVLDYPGCDGLKTGYIIEAGYNLAATAERDGTRYIVVTLGGTGGSSLGGGEQRSRDGSSLLDWAFDSFATARPDVGELPSPRAWYGAGKRVTLVPAEDLGVSAPRAVANSVSVRVVAPRSLDAPVARGAKIGEVVYSAGSQVLRRVDLVAEREVGRVGFFGSIFEAVAKFFATLLGKA
jgi:D-alanyl-D-alanine carboxypeptidase (penicillin-binding protein 5/6)